MRILKRLGVASPYTLVLTALCSLLLLASCKGTAVKFESLDFTDDAPVILSLDGDGSPDLRLLSDHAAHYFKTTIRLFGRNLTDATVDLLQRCDRSQPITSCAVRNAALPVVALADIDGLARLAVGLPQDLEGGSYTLKVTNGVGQYALVDASILQGEPGVCDATACGAGQQASLPGASVVSRVEFLPSTTIGGAGIEVHLAATNSTASLTGTGFYLLALTRTTHETAKDVQNGSYLISGGDAATRIANLYSALNALSTNKDLFVIVMSQGNVAAALNQAVPGGTNLADMLTTKFNASASLASLSTTGSFALVTYLGAGETSSFFQMNPSGTLQSTVLLIDNLLLASPSGGAVPDGTITLADLAASSCTANQMIRRNSFNTAWECAAVSSPITYSAGAGLSLTGTTFAASGITSAMITDGTVASADIADGTVTSTDILDNTVASADITDGSIAFADIGINTCVASNVIKRNAGNTAWECGTDASTSYTAGAGLSLTGTVFAASGITSAMITDGTIASADIADGTVASADILDGTVASADIADGTIAFTDIGINTCAASNVIKRNAGNTAWECGTDANTSYTAGAGLSLTGNAFAVSGVTSAMITDSTIASVDILDGAVASADITDGTIAFVDIGSNTCLASAVIKRNAGNTAWECGTDTNTTYAAGAGLALTGTTFSASGITSAMITDSTIASIDIADGTVASADITDGTIAFADIATNGCAADTMLRRNAGNTAWECSKNSLTVNPAGGQPISFSTAGVYINATSGSAHPQIQLAHDVLSYIDFSPVTGNVDFDVRVSYEPAVNGGMFAINGKGSTFVRLNGALPTNGVVTIGPCLRVSGASDIGTCSSDERLKENIEYIQFGDALTKLNAIRPASYRFKNSDGTTHIGVIAQDLKEQLPELVSQGDDGYLRVEYGKLDFVVMEAVKELGELNAALQAKTDSLMADNARLQAHNAELQIVQTTLLQRLDALEARLDNALTHQ